MSKPGNFHKFHTVDFLNDEDDSRPNEEVPENGPMHDEKCPESQVQYVSVVEQLQEKCR